jgi:hypothetical protein
VRKKQVPQAQVLGFGSEVVNERQSLPVIAAVAVRNVLIVFVHGVNVLVHEIDDCSFDFQGSFGGCEFHNEFFMIGEFRYSL